MRDERRNIFNDGEIVETIIMPEEIFRGHSWEKQNWAETALADYVSKFHGRSARFHVIGNLTSDNRTTGTKASFLERDKEIIYMIMEPKAEKQPGTDGKYRVHIIKAEYETGKEATMLDVIEHKLEAHSFSCGFFEAARVKGQNSGGRR
jgi:hypothetical protein